MRRALVAVVLVHLGVSIVHGLAHAGAQVLLPPAAMAFVYVVILAGPPAGLVVLCWRERLGAALVAATMTGAFLFGLVNHFIVPGSDHVAHVAAARRPLFATTAALLAIIEASGAAIAMRYALVPGRRAP
jgi:hypothetical protein